MAKEPEIVSYEIADKTGKIVATGEAGSRDVVIPNLTPNTDYAKGDYKGRKIDPAGEWRPSDYLEIEGFKTKPVAVTGVSLDNTNLSLETGKTATLKATVAPGNATIKTTSWSSDTAAVATVDNAGKVTAVKAGTAKITVKTTDGAKTAVCTVTVKDPIVKVESVSLNKTSTTIDVGKTEKLIATVKPDTATNKGVTWSSDDSSTASIKDGIITGAKAGTTTVKATTSDGGKAAECTVTVKIPVVAVTDVSLDQTEASIEEGATAQLKATVAPSNATDKTVTWKSGNPETATVDSAGKVTGVKAGTCNVVATTKDGGKTATCAITVTAKSTEPETPPEEG